MLISGHPTVDISNPSDSFPLSHIMHAFDSQKMHLLEQRIIQRLN